MKILEFLLKLESKMSEMFFETQCSFINWVNLSNNISLYKYIRWSVLQIDNGAISCQFRISHCTYVESSRLVVMRASCRSKDQRLKSPNVKQLYENHISRCHSLCGNWPYFLPGPKTPGSKTDGGISCWRRVDMVSCLLSCSWRTRRRRRQRVGDVRAPVPAVTSCRFSAQFGSVTTGCV